jgi:hypothetical protein
VVAELGVYAFVFEEGGHSPIEGDRYMGGESFFSIEELGRLAILIGFVGGLYDARDDLLKDAPMKARRIDVIKEVVGVAGRSGMGVVSGNKEVAHLQAGKSRAKSPIDFLIHSYRGHAQVHLYPKVRPFRLRLKDKSAGIKGRFYSVGYMAAITPA